MYGPGLSLRVPTSASLEENPSQYRSIRDVGAVVNAQEEADWTTTFLAPDRPIMAMDLCEAALAKALLQIYPRLGRYPFPHVGLI
jgi:hypothetical protein